MNGSGASLGGWPTSGIIGAGDNNSQGLVFRGAAASSLSSGVAPPRRLNSLAARFSEPRTLE